MLILTGRFSRFLPVPLALALVVGLAACGKQAPQAIAPDAAAQQVPGSFDKAEPAVKEMADSALQAMTNGNLPRAHMLLQSLAARTDLTPEQRDVVTSSLLGVGQKLRESAVAGDETALEFQRMHQSSK